MDAQQLPRLSRADLTRLTTLRVLPNLTKIPLFLGLMVVAGVLTWTTDSAIVDWTMYVLLGYLWMSIVTFMHDATHHTLFRRRWLNAAFGIVAMIPVGVSFVAFRKDHLEHHRHNRSPRDPDAFTMGRRGVADMVLFYAYMVAGALLSFLHFNVLYPIRSFDRREWAMHLFEMALKVAACVGLVYWALAHDTLGKTLALWLIPIFIFSLFNSVRFIAEHYNTPWDQGQLLGTRTISSNRRARVLLEQHQLAHRASHLPQGALVQPRRAAPAAEGRNRRSRRHHRQELHRRLHRCAAPRSGNDGSDWRRGSKLGAARTDTDLIRRWRGSPWTVRSWSSLVSSS